jgi:hypothetical protein
MAAQENTKQLRIKGNVNQSQSVKEKKNGDHKSGRRMIIILFLLTIGLSIVFWLQSQLSVWWKDFFGPSKWTFSR